MLVWGNIPEWIAAAGAVGSLAYLADYVKSAREQVTYAAQQLESLTRPVVIINQRQEDNRFFFRNLGPGPALNVVWSFSPEAGRRRTKHRAAIETNLDYDFGDPVDKLFHPENLLVNYESSSGRK